MELIAVPGRRPPHRPVPRIHPPAGPPGEGEGAALWPCVGRGRPKKEKPR